MRKNIKKILNLATMTTLSACFLTSCSSNNAKTDEPVVETDKSAVITDYENNVIQTSYDASIFEVHESAEGHILFTTEEEYAVVSVIAHDSKEFITGLTNMILDPDLKSEELYDALFWESVSHYYDFDIADETPIYIINGMGTTSLDKPVSVCEAVIYVEAFDDYPDLKFDVKMVGSEESGAMIKVIYEATLEDDVKNDAENSESLMNDLYSLRDSMAIKTYWTQEEQEDGVNAKEADKEEDLEEMEDNSEES